MMVNPTVWLDNLTSDTITWLSAEVDNITQQLTNVTEDPMARLEAEVHEKKQYVRLAYFYSLAAILPIGILCNCLTITVFCVTPALRRSTTGQYLVAMATADTLVLIGEMFRWGSYTAYGTSITGDRFMHSHDIPCKLTYFLRYSFMLVSSWVTVAITTERFITVAFPLKVTTISTPTRARMTILIIVALGIALGAFPFWTIHRAWYEKKGYHLCMYSDWKQYQIWDMAVLQVCELIIPGCIIIIMTTLIIIHLLLARRRRRQMRMEVSGGLTSGARNVEGQLTTMLLCVACAFVVLRVPHTTAYYIDRNQHDNGPKDPEAELRTFTAKKVAEIFFISNYAVNFFLYCFSGSIFRRHLFAMFCCAINKRRDIDQVGSLRTKTTSIRHQMSLHGNNRNSTLDHQMALLGSKHSPRTGNKTVNSDKNISCEHSGEQINLITKQPDIIPD